MEDNTEILTRLAKAGLRAHGGPNGKMGDNETENIVFRTALQVCHAAADNGKDDRGSLIRQLAEAVVSLIEHGELQPKSEASPTEAERCDRALAWAEIFVELWEKGEGRKYWKWAPMWEAKYMTVRNIAGAYGLLLLAESRKG